MDRRALRCLMAIILIAAGAWIGCRRAPTTAVATEAPTTADSNTTAPPVPLLPPDLAQDLEQVWTLRDQLQQPGADDRVWMPSEYAPHLWRRLNARLLDLEQRARGGAAFDKQQVRKVVREYTSGLQSIGAQQPLSEGTDVLRQLAQAAGDFHAAGETSRRDSFRAELPELNEAGKSTRGYLRALAPAVDLLRWQAQLGLLVPPGDRTYTELTRQLHALLDGLARYRDCLRAVETQGLDAATAAQLRSAWRDVQQTQDALAQLVNSEVQRLAESTPAGRDDLRVQTLLATPLISASQRRSLWTALERTVAVPAAASRTAAAESSLPEPRLPDRARLREQLELEWKLVTLADPAVAAHPDNPVSRGAATLRGSASDADVWLALRDAGQWLAEFYTRLPQRIAEQAASDPALAQRLLRLVDARDALRLPERAGADSWPFPELRIQPPRAAARLVVARRDATTPDVRLSLQWQPIVLTVDTGHDVKSVSVRVDYDDPAAIAIRRPGQEDPLPPGTRSDVPLSDDGLIVYELRALKLATGANTDHPVRLQLQAGDLQEELTLPCKLPQPNEIELRAECLLPREAATSRGLLGVQLRPFPNRTTTYQLTLVNLADEPKEVEVQLLAVRRPAAARFGLGRLLDALGKPYMSPAGDVVATAKSISLPADGLPHAITFDAPSTPPSTPAASEGAAAPAATTPPAPATAPPTPAASVEHPITDGLVCAIRNLQNPQETWVRWIELQPRLPREYLTVRSDYSADTRRIEVQAALPDVDRDGQPDLRELPADLQGSPQAQIVWQTRGQVTARASNGVFSGAVPTDGSALSLWAEIPPAATPQTVLMPLTIDGYPRALLHSLTTNRYDRGTDERARRRHVRINALSLGDRVCVTSRAAPEPPVTEGQPPPVYLEAGAGAAFPAAKPDSTGPLTVHFEVDAPLDAFGEPIDEQYDEIQLGWEGEPPLTFYSDRQVDMRLVQVSPDGQIALQTRVQDYTCTLATAGKTGRFVVVAGGRIEQRELPADRVQVLLDHLPPEVLSFRPRRARVTQGEPIVLDLETKDLSGVAGVKLALTKQPQADLSPDAATIPNTQTATDDRTTLQLSLDTDANTAPGTYWVQAEVTDRVGFSRKTGGPDFEPASVRVERRRTPAKPETPTSGPVKGTLKGYVVFGTLDYRPSDFQVQIKGTSRRTTSESRGAFRFDDVPAGEYTLEASGSLQGKSVRGEAPVKLQSPNDYANDVVITVK